MRAWQCHQFQFNLTGDIVGAYSTLLLDIFLFSPLRNVESVEWLIDKRIGQKTNPYAGFVQFYSHYPRTLRWFQTKKRAEINRQGWAVFCQIDVQGLYYLDGLNPLRSKIKCTCFSLGLKER